MPAIPFGPGAWHKALICLLLAAIGPAIPAFSAAGTGLLTLAEVQQLALLEQPALVAGEANVHALRDEAVVAGQLPDPQLIAGINQLPVNEGEAFSLRDDDFTALSVGISQEFPRAAKRQLRAIALEQQAKAAEVGLTAVERRVKLRAALAYLDVASAAQAAVLLDRLGAEAETQLAVRGIAVVSGQGSQSEQLAAGVEAEVLADRGRALRQRELAGRAELARWIGPISRTRM
ncbi:MAG: TolC family protein [Gammaproteobacteria bacterium]